MGSLRPHPDRVPAGLEKGRTAEAKTAFEQRPLPEWEAMAQKLRPEAERVRATMPPRRAVVAPDGLIAPVANIRPETHDMTADMFRSGPAPRAQTVTVDADADRLPDALEQALWQSFVPIYLISAGEKNNFAYFKDVPGERIIDRVQATPPVGYYSVAPLFRLSINRVPYGFAQITYATFWDRDDGPAVVGPCLAFARIVSALTGVDLVGIARGLGGHPFDEERSAALVGAPIVGASYNGDPAAYHLYSFYTAAHEGTISDRGMYLWFDRRPIAPGSHIALALSLSKHATYPFNPTGLSLVPGFLIASALFTIQGLLELGVIQPRVYLALMHIVYLVAYECLIERWQPRDSGVYPSPSINVGSVERPINNSRWITHEAFAKKLKPAWSVRSSRWFHSLGTVEML